MRSSVWLFTAISLGAMALACGSKPPGSGVTDGTGGSGAYVGQAGDQSGIFLPDEPPPDPTLTCRAADSCAPLECGPRPDGCGQFIECGTCSDPAMTCGGAGVPSFCGVPGTGGGGDGDGDPNCIPETCASLNVSCGQTSDGCGHVLTCSPCTVAGEECVRGQCVVSDGCDQLDCTDYPETGRCGPVSDGCSGILDCGFGSCGDGERCGAVEPGFCGQLSCQPFETCEQALAGKPAGYCGFVSDGCAGAMPGNCGTVCTNGETCGVAGDAGGYLQICGNSGGGGGGCLADDQAVVCQGKCGLVTDGCSSTYDCGSCTPGDVCGLYTGNVCGTPPACIPSTCEELNVECGTTDDGCGGPLDCGGCANGQLCGATESYQCGSACQPMAQAAACAQANSSCGPQSDGCDGSVNCGSCGAGESCVGVQSQCVSNCTPLTCQDIGATCGQQGDGCEGSLNCGTCASGQVCQGTPSACVEDPACSHFCQNQATCAPGNATRVTGVVHAPNGSEPLFNALVYVPNIAQLSNLPAISTGPSCERCEDEDLGDPLVAAITGPDGSFTLDNVPAGVNFPLVVKMGKWRRVVMIPAIAGCSSQPLSVDDVRLPRHRNDAAVGMTQYVNLPKFAMVTGQVDAIECVLRKIGVADSEFTAPAGTGRVHLYKGDNNGTGSNGANGAGTSAGGTGTSVSQLFSGTTMNNYDAAIFDCEGPNSGSDAAWSAWRGKLHDFANAGGRVFASHFEYQYLYNNNTFNNVATWGTGPTSTASNSDNMREATAHNPTTGIIDQGHAKGQAFDAWLGLTNALHPTYGDGYINIKDPRGFVRAVNSSAERFVYTDQNHLVTGYTGTGAQPNGDINVDSHVEQFAFNTPVGAAPDVACGRVVYSGFHVTGTGGTLPNYNGNQFPAHCDNGPLSAQEKALEFMLFDLSSCVSVSAPPSCVPETCQELGATCGYVSDGCGGLQNCGTCTAPATCGGGGTRNQCGSSCTLTNCAAEGATCGVIGNGCGGTLECGTCTPPAVCGGGGTANVCGVPACTPRSCQSVGATCGNIGDGCGGTLNCGACTSGKICGGAGPNTCGTSSCAPTGCGSAECGTVGDGCGNAINCGSCSAGSACGAGGANRCGPVCTPQTCLQAGKNCGFIGDGCGGVLDCGTCSEGVICGGGGTANVCGGNCDSTTCLAENANCGTLGDGCGGVLNCGTCPPGQVCGAQTANQCGSGTCTADTCGARCGIQSDGCSGTLNCGPCNGCVPYACTPNNDCGPVADGCGGLKDCGVCSNGNTCGGGGVASKCGGGIQ